MIAETTVSSNLFLKIKTKEELEGLNPEKNNGNTHPTSDLRNWTGKSLSTTVTLSFVPRTRNHSGIDVDVVPPNEEELRKLEHIEVRARKDLYPRILNGELITVPYGNGLGDNVNAKVWVKYAP